MSTTSVLHGTWQYMPIRLQDFYAWLADMLHILASHPWKSFFMQKTKGYLGTTHPEAPVDGAGDVLNKEESI
ncbi:hypothetical protein CBFG_04685 [Clostridiales bacterium 1_7_47FAA]|nr:hypothetical protein CBFG_04685 [Clostridiales bacterium 1_7_47FAA]